MKRLQILLSICWALSTACAPLTAQAADPSTQMTRRYDPFLGSRIVPPSAVASTVWYFGWECNFRSAEGRPIETVRVGRGRFRTLVVGSVHGSEPMAVAVVERLANHLGNQPDHWRDVNALFVKTPNPDGLARGGSFNSRGVDLNRDFPAGEAAMAKSRSGPERDADCEIETRAVCRLLRTYRPHRVLHVKSTRDPVGWALCNRQARGAANFLFQCRSLRVGGLEERLVPGSLESYASNTLGLETITLAVPHEPGPSAIWRDYRNALLAAVAYVDPDWRPDASSKRWVHRPAESVNRREPRRLPWFRSRVGDSSSAGAFPHE